MEGTVIKSFLVGLGFQVDDKSLDDFNKSIADTAKKVTSLYVSINAAATAVGYAISGISQDFEKIGYEYRIIAPAINKAIWLRQEMFKAYNAAGINITKVVQASVKLNMSIAKTKFALDAIYKSVGSRFFELLTKQSDIFRNNIYKNMPKIQAALERFVKFIFKAFEAVTELGTRLWSILTRVYDFFVTLDKATDGWSTYILAAIAAWKLLNLAFLATPLGMIISGLVALLGLWDDFKTFQEGGKSLINWGSETTKMIVGLVAVIGTIVAAYKAWQLGMLAFNAVMQAYDAILALTTGLEIAAAAPIWAIIAAITALTAALALADSKWKIFGGGLSGAFSNVGGKVMDMFGGLGKGGEQNAQNAQAVIGNSSAPLGSHGANNNQTNQNVSQQTTINLMGTADAGSNGKSVAGEQSKVNFNMVRNLKGVVKK